MSTYYQIFWLHLGFTCVGRCARYRVPYQTTVLLVHVVFPQPMGGIGANASCNLPLPTLRDVSKVWRLIIREDDTSPQQANRRTGTPAPPCVPTARTTTGRSRACTPQRAESRSALISHLLPASGAARVGLVLLLGALLAEVVPAVGHDGVAEPLPADDAGERQIVVALNLHQPTHPPIETITKRNSHGHRRQMGRSKQAHEGFSRLGGKRGKTSPRR